MTQYLTVDGGRLAYDVDGSGPLVVLVPGLGDRRQAYRHLVPRLLAAGYRVAATDPRGQGESSVAWPDYSRSAIAEDLLALVRELGGPAVLVGHSFAGGAVTIAAAAAPELVTALVEIGPFTRPTKVSLTGLITNRRYRRGTTKVTTTLLTGSVGRWSSYLDFAYPGQKPADWDSELAALQATMRQEGRMRVLRKMATSDAGPATQALSSVRCPTLIVMGTLDPDWPEPTAEAGAIVDELPDGLGRTTMIDAAGHYPHAQYPLPVADAMTSFLSALPAS